MSLLRQVKSSDNFFFIVSVSHSEVFYISYLYVFFIYVLVELLNVILQMSNLTCR